MLGLTIVACIGTLATPSATKGSGSGSPGGAEDGDSGYSYTQFPCYVDARTPVEHDEPTPLGFSPDDLEAAIGGPHAVSLTWADGSSVGGSFGVSVGDGVEMVDVSVGSFCVDHLDVPLTLTLATDDGALDEVWDATGLVKVVDRADFTFGADAIGGSWVPPGPVVVHGVVHGASALGWMYEDPGWGDSGGSGSRWDSTEVTSFSSSSTSPWFYGLPQLAKWSSGPPASR